MSASTEENHHVQAIAVCIFKFDLKPIQLNLDEKSQYVSKICTLRNPLKK